MAALKKIQSQSYSAYEVLAKERLRVQQRQMSILTSELEDLR